MLLIGILIGFFIPFENAFLRTACKILLLPLTVGIGFEFLMYAGKHDNPLVRIPVPLPDFGCSVLRPESRMRVRLRWRLLP